MPLDGDFELDAAMPVRGVATSGWRGRSFSLGIADSVTVLAADAAAADAAATMIANAVDVDHPAIVAPPGERTADDTDLGDRPVTVAVGALTPALVRGALERGAALARARACARTDPRGGPDAAVAPSGGGSARRPGRRRPHGRWRS